MDQRSEKSRSLKYDPQPLNLIFYAFLCLDTGFEGMLYFFHFRYEIGNLYDFRRGVSTC